MLTFLHHGEKMSALFSGQGLNWLTKWGFCGELTSLFWVLAINILSETSWRRNESNLDYLVCKAFRGEAHHPGHEPA